MHPRAGISADRELQAPLPLDSWKPDGYSNQMVTNARPQGEVVFRAIADPTRRRILGLLRQRPHTVGELAGNFQSSRPAISKHLRLLRAAGLVIAQPRGTASVCRLNALPLRAVNDWLQDYQTFWKGTLRDLKRYVEEER